MTTTRHILMLQDTALTQKTASKKGVRGSLSTIAPPLADLWRSAANLDPRPLLVSMVLKHCSVTYFVERLDAKRKAQNEYQQLPHQRGKRLAGDAN
ncbi:unnamed protein product [Gongylonema pulchrum]|uniref:Transposase n=1 Tax=Gongylonema pulchrum TaxID=637853 RepID=A0A183DT72_9BILA|nr:unnamed protein product [Gongylonema pulchrum]